MAGFGTMISMARQRPVPEALGSTIWHRIPSSTSEKLGADLGLLVRRENVDDTVDGLRRRVRVQGAEGQVAGFRDAQRGLDGLESRISR